jgi:catechol 2,3-dioxygenase-like lactoylglutathione lyase family enzyme
MMISGIHHSCFTVSNLERSIAFYRDVLGLELVFVERSESSGDDRSKNLGVAKSNLSLAIFRVGDTHVELIEYITPKGRPYDRVNSDIGAAHVAFKVDDIDAVYQALLAKQVRFTAPPATVPAGPMKGWRWTYFYDPDGISLELLETN